LLHRASVCLSNLNVKLIGAHLGFASGPYGAIALSLEDVALLRVLPNMTIIQPVDAIEARKAVIAMAETTGPMYIRVSKAAIPAITTKETPFELGKAQVLVEGKDATLISSGPVTYEALLAVRELALKHKLSVELINCSTIKPLDEETILSSIRKTNRVITVEEHQQTGGLGGAVAELTAEKFPVHVKRIGMPDIFGQSGQYKELLDKYGLSSHNIVKAVLEVMKESRK
jgi:transketolase